MADDAPRIRWGSRCLKFLESRLKREQAARNLFSYSSALFEIESDQWDQRCFYISLSLSGLLYVIDTFWKIVATMSNFLNLTACNVAPPMVGNCRNQRGTFPQRVEWLMGEWLGSGAVCPSARNSLNGASTAGYLYLFSEAFEVAFACRMTSTLPGWQEKLSGGSQKWLLKYGQCLL